MNLILVIFWISGFLIFWAMAGYPISIIILGKTIFKNKVNSKIPLDYPSVTVLIVAHNEEKVIKEKLQNVTKIDYPTEKIQFVVSSDNSTDNTNNIVNEFIRNYENSNLRLYQVKERMGKTNAQDEAVKTIESDYIVFTDANSILKDNCIKELISSFSTEDICYVTGRLIIVNEDISMVSSNETSYWNLDLLLRDIESRIQTITAGNGALYACRRKDYEFFNPIESHDSAMPLFYALNKKRAICNHKAIAFEKASELVEDEFNRKVRMNRLLLKRIFPSFKILNIFKYKWFSYFYLGHRTCRYLLWLNHILLFMASVILVNNHLFYTSILILQILFYMCALVVHIFDINNKFMKATYYYCITIIAQLVGVKNNILGKSSAIWEKSESSR